MKVFYIYNIIIVLIIFSKCNCDSNPIDIEQFLYRLGRRVIWFMSENTNSVYKQNQLVGKVQKVLDKSQNFYCDTQNSRSITPPNSINQLRPGDIDIIGVIGDSISAANGGISNDMLHTGIEYRGIAFSGGGYRNWRKFLTLPNILKEFNPNLYGYSTVDSSTADHASKFNVAEPMLMSRDIYFAANILTKRMLSDPLVNMTHHWKLISLYIGNLDFCVGICQYETVNEWLADHEKDLVKTLRFLRNKIPRLFINLIGVPNLMVIKNINFTTSDCRNFVHGACPCIFKYDADAEYYKYIKNGLKLWKQLQINIASRDEFNTEDFVVINQPFLTNLEIPLDNNGQQETRYFATDCFHFSQVGHAHAAVELWNNMLEPVTDKSTKFNISFPKFLCPSQEFPYLITRKNIQGSWKPNLSLIGQKVLKQIL